MIVRFVRDATMPQRRAVEEALQEMGVAATPVDGALVLHDPIDGEKAVSLASMPAVAEIAAETPDVQTVRESLLDWTAAATAVTGVLVIVAANLPAELGTPADPLRTPGDLVPSWPLFPYHAAVDRLPAWVPTSLLGLVAGVLLVGWPWIGARLAKRSRAAHTALGIVVVVALLAFAALELSR